MAIRARIAAVLLIVQLLATFTTVAALIAQFFFTFPEKEVMGWAMGVGLVAGLAVYRPLKVLAVSRDDYEIYAICIDALYLLLGGLVVAVGVGGKAWVGSVAVMALWVIAYLIGKRTTREVLQGMALAALIAGLIIAVGVLPVYAWFATGNYSWTLYLMGLVPACVYGLMVWERFSRQVIPTE